MPYLADSAVFAISDSRLSDFAVAMERPSAPLSQSAIAELPKPIAEVADEPVAVRIRNISYTRTIGSIYRASSTPEPVREAVREHAQKEYQYVTMTNQTHIYKFHEEKSFDLHSFDGAKGTDMGTITLKLGEDN